MVNKVIRTLINLLVSDLIDTTQNNIKRLSIKNYQDVRNAPEHVAAFSKNIEEANQELKKFLTNNLYRHYRVVRMSIKAQRVIRDLFKLYVDYPDALPHDFFRRIESDGLKHTISDYIAGMTDRFAIEEHQKLTEPMIRV
jgi:dGTPase